VKKFILALVVTVSISGCTSTKSIDTNECIKVANTVENNEAKSGNDLFNECLDKQYHEKDAQRGFWENSLEGLLFFVLDMTTS
jgi:hypothetical protein